MTGILRAAGSIFRRELAIAMRRRAQWIQPLVFYVLISSVFPLGLDPSDPALRAFAPAIVWVGALLAALLAVEPMFRGDLEDGTLEQWLVADLPLALLVSAKLTAQWVLVAAPLVAVAPVVAMMLGLDARSAGVLTAGLLLGTPVLIYTASFAAALTVEASSAGILVPLLVLPLMTPAVIFGTGAVRAAQSGLDFAAPLYFLAALLALSLSLLPFAIAGALRNALQ